MRLIKKIFAFLLVLIIIASSAIISAGWGKYKQAIKLIPREDAAKKIKTQNHVGDSEVTTRQLLDTQIILQNGRTIEGTLLNPSQILVTFSRGI